MGAAIELRGEFDGPALRRLAKATRHAGQARRLLALAVIYDGGSRGDAARIGDVGHPPKLLQPAAKRRAFLSISTACSRCQRGQEEGRTLKAIYIAGIFGGMAPPRLRLPPFAALRAFHASAVHGRFRDAAESLGVTESAISHQVRRLEDFLHTALFDRSGPGVRLTPAGRRYLDDIDPAIRQIQSATDALLGPSGRRVVRLTLAPSLALNWLIPRLGAFEREHPDIELQLVTTTRVLDLQRDQIDLALRHGEGVWPGLKSTFLLAETVVPVCAPAISPGSRRRIPWRRCAVPDCS